MKFRFLWQRLGDLGTFSGALAFYFLLALVPLLIVAAVLVQSTLQVDIVPQLAELLRELLPHSQSSERMAQALFSASGMNRGWFTLGFAGTLWASFSFMSELARAIHRLFADRIDQRSGGNWRWVKAIALNVLWCAVLVLVCMLFIFSTALEHEMAQWSWLQAASAPVVQASRWVVTFLALATAMTFTYRLIPEPSPRLRACALTGTLVALAWMGMGGALTRALPLIWGQSPLPIAFGSFFLTMFWAYACCWVMLAGALGLALFTRRTGFY